MKYWAVVMLILASVACNLSSSSDEPTLESNPSPTSNLLAPTLASTPQNLVPNTDPNPPTIAVQDSQYFIVITSPEAGSRVNRNGFIVKGQQRGSLENKVVVQARDAAGNVIQQVATTAIGELGQVGTWEVTLSAPTVPDGTRGSVYAFYTSPQDEAYWQIEVTYINQ